MRPVPFATPGLKVGLLGGSFDPPHAGHVHISRWALRRFGLDRVWWLVSPGNPLKPEGPAPMDRRLAACRELVSHPRMVVSDIEARMGTRHTAGTLAGLFRWYPGVRFVWLMGADNLGQFHRWENWQWIMENIPIGVMARHGEQVSAGFSTAATRYRRFRLDVRRARGLPYADPPAWCLLTGRMVDRSSSEIRARGEWDR